jgi:hypothetical protein
MSSHLDSFVASGTSPTPDFRCENHSSIFLLYPLSPGSKKTSHQMFYGLAKL